MAQPDLLDEIARKHAARLVLQFGSTVTGRTHARSDLDLAVLLERSRPSLRERAALRRDLQEAFPEREVDLVVLNRADPLLLDQVARRCRLLAGTERDFQRFRLYAFKRYQDHRRFLDLERRYVARSLAVRHPPLRSRGERRARRAGVPGARAAVRRSQR